MRKRERNIRLFGFVLLLAGIGLSLWGTLVAVQAWLTTTWPTTEGVIIAANVEERVNVNASEVEEDKLDYVAAVQYTYVVNGETLTADNIRTFEDRAFGTRSDAQTVVDGYRPGDPITVYYNPNNAEQALLQPGVPGASLIPLGFGLFGLLSGLMFVLRPELI